MIFLFVISALLFVMNSRSNAEDFGFRRLHGDNSRAAEDAGEGVAFSLEAGGKVRNYMVYEPAAAAGKKLPLMVVLHGGLGNSRSIERSTGMNRVADREGFIVAYPDGTEIARSGMKGDRRTWNAGSCCGLAARQGVNDVAFIGKIIEDISSRYNADRRRVYVAGFSNGGMMAYRLACEIPGKIAAIIPVSGALTIDSEVGKDVAVLHIHGAADNHVPFGGGEGALAMAGVSFRPVQETIKLVTRTRGCGAPVERDLNGNVRVFSYHCREGAPVELYVIRGGGHVWPGSHRKNTEEPDTGGISASQIAWDFAKQFSK